MNSCRREFTQKQRSYHGGFLEWMLNERRGKVPSSLIREWSAVENLGWRSVKRIWLFEKLFNVPLQIFVTYCHVSQTRYNKTILKLHLRQDIAYIYRMMLKRNYSYVVCYTRPHNSVWLEEALGQWFIQEALSSFNRSIDRKQVFLCVKFEIGLHSTLTRTACPRKSGAYYRLVCPFSRMAGFEKSLYFWFSQSMDAKGTWCLWR